MGGMGAKENALDSIEELSEDGTQWTKLSKIYNIQSIPDIVTPFKFVTISRTSFYRCDSQRPKIPVLHVGGAEGLHPGLLTSTVSLYV